MANVGFRGGEIADLTYWNRIIKSYRLQEKHNIMLNTKFWAKELSGGAPNSNKGTISFYWNSNKNISLVSFQTTRQSIPLSSSAAPAIVSCVDRTGTAVAYSTVGSATVQTEDFELNGIDLRLHITTTEYSKTSATSEDVWVEMEAFSGVKDIAANTEFNQFMVIQHPSTLPTLRGEVIDGEVANPSDYNGLANYFEGGERISYCLQIWRDVGGTLTPYNIENRIFDPDWNEYDFENCEIYSSVDCDFIGSCILGPFSSRDKFSVLNTTVTSYTQGNLHTFSSTNATISKGMMDRVKNRSTVVNNIGLASYNVDDSIDIDEAIKTDLWHVSFPIGGKRGMNNNKVTQNSVNSADLFRLKENHEMFQKYAYVPYCYRRFSPSVGIQVQVYPEGLFEREQYYFRSFNIGSAPQIPVRYQVRLP